MKYLFALLYISGAARNIAIEASVRAKADADLFQSAMTIVDSVLKDKVVDSAPKVDLPTMNNLVII